LLIGVDYMSETNRHEVMIGGTGGQGAQTIGYVLAEAASRVCRNVTRFPIYLAMQRGGAAYCTVIFSDEEIAAPILSTFDNAIAMDAGSYEKFRGGLRRGGKLVFNGSIIKVNERDGISQYPVPVIDMAKELGATALANMIMLGAYRHITGVLSDDMVIGAMQTILSQEGREDRMKSNIAAYNKGAEYVHEQKWA